jgi:hypothetical protein
MNVFDDFAHLYEHPSRVRNDVGSLLNQVSTLNTHIGQLRNQNRLLLTQQERMI